MITIGSGLGSGSFGLWIIRVAECLPSSVLCFSQYSGISSSSLLYRILFVHPGSMQVIEYGLSDIQGIPPMLLL